MSIITPKRKNRALGEDNLLVTFKPWVLLRFISACWNVIASLPPPPKKNKTEKNSEEKLDFRL